VPETIVFRCPGRAVPGGPIGFRLADTFWGSSPKLIVSRQIKLLLKLMVSGLVIPLLILRISGMFLGAPKLLYFRSVAVFQSLYWVAERGKTRKRNVKKGD
jgi:hypothetical protein